MLNPEPTVSIILNNYNYGQFLQPAIESALHQTYPATEVIVVDDGSTDCSREVIATYGERILPVLKENGGQASALNAGFAHSRGKHIIFLDADDLLLPETAQRVVSAFQSRPETAKVMYRMAVVDPDGAPTGELKPAAHLPLLSGDLRRQVLTFPFDMTWMGTSGNAFPARILRSILPIPEDDYPILADYYLSHLAPLFGEVQFLSEVGAYYRVHGKNQYASTSKTIQLGQIYQTLSYATRTLHHIQALAEQLNLPDRPQKAEDLLGVSLIAQRLISLKLDPANHPDRDDRAWRLAKQGAAAALRRFDVTHTMRALYLAWFLAMAPAPRPLANRLGELFAFPERREGLNRILGKLHPGAD